MRPESKQEFSAFVGIDWADRKHDFCVQAAGASAREFGVLLHQVDVIAQWAGVLQQLGGPPAGGESGN